VKAGPAPLGPRSSTTRLSRRRECCDECG
jgi:hypothetical protein